MYTCGKVLCETVSNLRRSWRRKIHLMIFYVFIYVILHVYVYMCVYYISLCSVYTNTCMCIYIEILHIFKCLEGYNPIQCKYIYICIIGSIHIYMYTSYTYAFIT